MVRIRLRRVGGHNQASFRIVAADKESPVKGRFIEVLGSYNPRTQPATIVLKEDRIYHWIGNGAQPSESAEQVFKQAGLLDRYVRFKAGEAIETLLAEADAAAKLRNADQRTRRPAPASSSRNKKNLAAAAAAAAAPAAPVAEAPAAEAEAPAEAAPADDAPAAE
ncbi:MAG: 30S ribosomal protein S16 [Anaerolineales bacterium]|jgi:small subunit ribosomal protein S16|nr:30S ribosomal protein S16 [Anaerolineales bacterium]MBX3006280.1 30S ribosomal protein S16 [Anaerolineales bacterium]MCW5888539.1 30S ribosomal protein S16 [Anaerolineales bacterium]